MAKTVYLNIDDELHGEIERRALEENTTVNLYLIGLLQKLHSDVDAFDYTEALNTLIKETESLPHEKEFVLNELESFREIAIVKAGDVGLKPTTVRARLGRAFNEAVAKELVPNISRAKTFNKRNEKVLKFRARAAVFVVNRDSNE